MACAGCPVLCLSALLPEAVQRGAKKLGGRGQPLGRRIVEVVERNERDMEEVGAAPRGRPSGSAAIATCTSGGGFAMT